MFALPGAGALITTPCPPHSCCTCQHHRRSTLLFKLLPAQSSRSSSTARVSQRVTVQATSLLEAQEKPQSELDPSSLRKVWDSTGKPLLRIGKTGVQASHSRSLQELLLAHKLVKVQINQLEQADVESSSQQLAGLADAELLQLKGRTALFAGKDVNKKSLLSQSVKSKKESLEDWWDKEHKAPVNLSDDVQQQLHHLRYSGVLGLDEPDGHCTLLLSRLPSHIALNLLKRMTPMRMKQVRNKSAYLNSQCRRLLGQAAR